MESVMQSAVLYVGEFESFTFTKILHILPLNFPQRSFISCLYNYLLRSEPHAFVTPVYTSLQPTEYNENLHPQNVSTSLRHFHPLHLEHTTRHATAGGLLFHDIHIPTRLPSSHRTVILILILLVSTAPL